MPRRSPMDVGELVGGEHPDGEFSAGPDLVAKRRLSHLERVDGRVQQRHDERGDLLAHLAPQFVGAQAPALDRIVQKPDRDKLLVECRLVEQGCDLGDVIKERVTVGLVALVAVVDLRASRRSPAEARRVTQAGGATPAASRAEATCSAGLQAAIGLTDPRVRTNRAGERPTCCYPSVRVRLDGIARNDLSDAYRVRWARPRLALNARCYPRGTTGLIWMRSSAPVSARRSLWTICDRTAHPRGDCCHVRGMRASAAGSAGRPGLVPSGRELRAGGDARIRGKGQPAGSRASCRSLLGFVHLSSERRAERVRQDSSFAEKQESRPALPPIVRSGRLAGGRRDACWDVDVASARCVSPHWAVALGMESSRDTRARAVAGRWSESGEEPVDRGDGGQREQAARRAQYAFDKRHARVGHRASPPPRRCAPVPVGSEQSRGRSSRSTGPSLTPRARICWPPSMS